jgi:hypothetical protein
VWEVGVTPEEIDAALREDAGWAAREAWWRRRLGRIRPGLEPLPEQLARLRRVTWGLTWVPAGIGAIILGIFSAFGAPGIGLVVVGVLLVPVVVGAWVEQWRLSRRVAAYERERAEWAARSDRDRAGKD